jgi:predicted ferric reductase
LAIKNTPLAFLTSYSYERLNILHQAAGCCTVISVVLHAILQLVSKAQLQALSVVVETPQIMAIVAGLSLLTTFTAAVFLRPVRYEAFYIIHVVMFMLVMIGIGMHRPNFSDQTIIITLVTACIWVSDRLIRALRLITLAIGNHATLTPLGQGGVRISMHRTPWRTTPGSHVFLCIPKIRSFEAHPFTVVSTNPLELVVSARDGFTRDLLSHATANPGATLRASCDGPYGALPTFSHFDQVVLIAGGSGASFTFGVALHLVRQAATVGGQPKINFTWVVKDHGKAVPFTPN